MPNERVASRSFRPEPAEYLPAQRLLSQRDVDMVTFLRGCLVRVVADPDFLTAMGPYLPPRRKRGAPYNNRNAAAK